MPQRHHSILIIITLGIVFLASCVSESVEPTSPSLGASMEPSAISVISSPTVSQTSLATVIPSPTPSPLAPVSPSITASNNSIIGTVVRFSTSSSSVDLIIDQDSPAVQDFLSLLPITITLEEFAGKEKIAYLPRELNYAGSAGSDPEDGDLIYYIPWGNIGFYYNTAGIGYSDQTIHLGRYTASVDQLKQLEGQAVKVEIIR